VQLRSTTDCADYPVCKDVQSLLKIAPLRLADFGYGIEGRTAHPNIRAIEEDVVRRRWDAENVTDQAVLYAYSVTEWWMAPPTHTLVPSEVMANGRVSTGNSPSMLPSLANILVTLFPGLM